MAAPNGAECAVGSDSGLRALTKCPRSAGCGRPAAGCACSRSGRRRSGWRSTSGAPRSRPVGVPRAEFAALGEVTLTVRRTRACPTRRSPRSGRSPGRPSGVRRVPGPGRRRGRRRAGAASRRSGSRRGRTGHLRSPRAVRRASRSAGRCGSGLQGVDRLHEASANHRCRDGAALICARLHRSTR